MALFVMRISMAKRNSKRQNKVPANSAKSAASAGSPTRTTAAERARVIAEWIENDPDAEALLKSLVDRLALSARLSERARRAALSSVTALSEAALAEDWNRPEEDAAWSYLQPGK
jgi:hypothetical protein